MPFRPIEVVVWYVSAQKYSCPASYVILSVTIRYLIMRDFDAIPTKPLKCVHLSFE